MALHILQALCLKLHSFIKTRIPPKPISNNHRKSFHPCSNLYVLLPDLFGLVLFLVLLVIDILEDVLEGSVILLEDRVLGGHVEWVATVQRVLEAAVGEVPDGLGRVVHAHGHAGPLQKKVIRKSFELSFGACSEIEREICFLSEVKS